METKLDSLHEKVDVTNNTLVLHIDEDKKSFGLVHNDLKEHERKIIKVMSVGGFLLIILGWVVNAIISNHA